MTASHVASLHVIFLEKARDRRSCVGVTPAGREQRRLWEGSLRPASAPSAICQAVSALPGHHCCASPLCTNARPWVSLAWRREWEIPRRPPTVVGVWLPRRPSPIAHLPRPASSPPPCPLDRRLPRRGNFPPHPSLHPAAALLGCVGAVPLPGGWSIPFRVPSHCILWRPAEGSHTPPSHHPRPLPPAHSIVSFLCPFLSCRPSQILTAERSLLYLTPLLDITMERSPGITKHFRRRRKSSSFAATSPAAAAAAATVAAKRGRSPDSGSCGDKPAGDTGVPATPLAATTSVLPTRGELLLAPVQRTTAASVGKNAATGTHPAAATAAAVPGVAEKSEAVGAPSGDANGGSVALPADPATGVKTEASHSAHAPPSISFQFVGARVKAAEASPLPPSLPPPASRTLHAPLVRPVRASRRVAPLTEAALLGLVSPYVDIPTRRAGGAPGAGASATAGASAAAGVAGFAQAPKRAAPPPPAPTAAAAAAAAALPAVVGGGGGGSGGGGAERRGGLDPDLARNMRRERVVALDVPSLLAEVAAYVDVGAAVGRGGDEGGEASVAACSRTWRR